MYQLAVAFFMTATIEIPDALAELMVDPVSSPSRSILESVAADAHRRGRITAFQVRQLLGHDSRWETHAFLSERHALSELSVEEILEDAVSIKSFRRSE